MYTFLFDRRSLALFLSGLGVAGILTFSAGMLIGMKIQLPVQTVQTADFEPLAAFEGGFIKSAEALPFERTDIGASIDPAAGFEQPAQPGQSDQPLPSDTTASAEPASSEPVPTASASAPASARAKPASDPVARRLRPSVVPEPVGSPRPVPKSGQAAVEPGAKVASEHPRKVASEPVPSRATSYFVQIGAYRLESTARGRAAALAAEGFEPEVVTLSRPVGGDLVAVRLGRFSTREEAVAQANEYVTRAPGREAIVREAS